MNILIDILPTTLNVSGVEYPIYHGFRTAILFELLVQDRKIPEDKKIVAALKLFYKDIPSDHDEAMTQLLWFYKGGKSSETKNVKNKTAELFRETKVVYSFEKDAGLIYAAFMSQYGIDLNLIEDMHWWKFLALFDGLSEDQRLCQVMQIRAMNTTGLPRNEVKRINELKKIYSLDDGEHVVNREEKLESRNNKMKDYIKRRMEEVKTDV